MLFESKIVHLEKMREICSKIFPKDFTKAAFRFDWLIYDFYRSAGLLTEIKKVNADAAGAT
jgi:hypothetical protein